MSSPMNPGAMRSFSWSRRCGSLLCVTISVLTLLGCGEDPPPSSSDSPGYHEVDPWSIIDSINVCVWRSDAKAACSLAFDDCVQTHLTTAVPELEKRGFRGTFNLNTARVADWSAWQVLYDNGHEIANHTRNHRFFRDLTDEEILNEVANGLADILGNIEGILFVPSFTYPGGSSTEVARSIVSNYHMNARGSWGINLPTPPDFMLIKGSPHYEPFDVAAMNRNLNRALAGGGWYLPYFHAISGNGPPGHCPTEIFQSHLDYIVEHRDSLWVAPQGEVARYIRERDAFRYEIFGESEHWLRIETGLDPALYNIPLTVRIFGSAAHGDRRLIIGDEEIRMPAGSSSAILDVLPESIRPIATYVLETP